MTFLSWKPLNSVPNTKNACVFLLMFVWWFVMTITLSLPPVGCIPTGTKPGILCKNIERQALLTLKAGLVDKAGRLSSWSDDNPNCCSWKGVSCSNHTGHVFKLNLRNPFENVYEEKLLQNRLEGDISSCLLELKYLEYLDLSLNFFNYTKFPAFLGSLEELRYLNLSSSSLSGVVPPSLGNLSRLEYLDLDSNYNGGLSLLEVGSWQWLTGMSSLMYLNLNGVNFSKAEGGDDWWGEVFNRLPNLLELHLRGCGLSNLPMSMINHHPINFTSSLSILDLSYNDFSSTLGMPPWLFNLTGLVDLCLSDCYLAFNIPHEIGRLVALKQLDLSENWIGGQLPASLRNLVTLNLRNNELQGRIPVTFRHFCNLQELILGRNRLEGDIHEFIDGLVTCSSDHPRLEILDLSFNRLVGTLPSSLGHLCKLRELNLRGNRLEGDMHEFIYGLATCSSDHPHLEFMDLSCNRLLGTLPSSLGSLSNLVYLYLFDSFSGPIPTTMGSLTALRALDLDSNKLNGTIAQTMGILPPDLETLALSYNQWREEMLNVSHFEKHTKLENLFLSSTSSKEGNLVLNMTQDWLPPFRRSLVRLRLDGMKMSSKMFPRWTRTLRELESLSLQDCGIADSIPTEFWTSCPNITRLYLSNNAISVRTTFINMGRLLPYLVPASKLKVWYLANISFGNNGGGSGIEIPSNIHQLAPSLVDLDLSSNSLSGEVPRSISRLQSLGCLTLRNNVLTGELAHLHWDDLTSLLKIDLSNNKLFGKIPQSLAHLPNLGLLLLNDNSLEGEIPALPNLPNLQVLDLGGNKLSGSIPPTLASQSPDLLVLRLRGNMLSGIIPLQLCLLSKLQTLDLAHNNFTGTIPWCLGNLSTTDSNQHFSNPITLVVKGREYKYDNEILRLVHLVDLSHNNLSGNIPVSLMNLTAMETLNLSMNHLTGEIPSNIGLLQELETLDLSQNHLSGPIPSRISDISTLTYLYLSHNNLSGRIPFSRHLQTLDTNYSRYDGNPLLCGDPLPTQCPGDGTPKDHPGEGEEKAEHGNKRFDIQEWGFVLSIVLGFIVGFWGVCGSLVLKPSWRQAYFGYLEGVKDKIIVVVVVNVTRLQRKVGISECGANPRSCFNGERVLGHYTLHVLYGVSYGI